MRDGATRVDPDPVPGYAATVGKGATLLLGERGRARPAPDPRLGSARRAPPAGRAVGDRRGPSSSRATELRTLGLEETLLHVACHLMVGGQPRGILVRDVAQLLAVPGLDPERATGLARRWGAEAVLAAAVRLAAASSSGWSARSNCSDWAAGYSLRLRDRAWLRIGQPGAALPAVEPVATWIELPPAGRRVLVGRHAASGSRYLAGTPPDGSIGWCGEPCGRLSGTR